MTDTARDRVLQALTDAGQQWRERGGQVTAQCPAHDDTSPSLTVGDGRGRVLLHCHAGCSAEQIVDALGLGMGDLFDQDAEPDGEQIADRPRIVAHYDYTDATGTVLFRKLRYLPKTFKVQRPDGRGGWTWGIGDAERVLYRLPDVVRAIREGQPAYVVEGEKDADRAAREGVTATCNFDGAGKWRPSYGDVLRGADVVLVVDNDEPGFSHGRTVVADLTGKAASVRMVRAAVDGKGADLSDHLAAGHTLDRLLLVDLDTAAEAWDPPEPIAKIAKTPLPTSHCRQPVALWAMVDAVAASYQVPRDMPFLLVLAILATSVGGRRRVRVAPDWAEVLALYAAVALPSGEKKSPVLSAVAAPLLAVEDQLREETELDVARQKALYDLRTAAVEKIKKSGRTDPDTISNLETAVQELEKTQVPAVPRLLADDSTPEALARLMAQQGGRLGVLSAEGGLFAILAGRYSSAVPNLDLVLKAWSGDQCRVDRISRDPLTLREPVLAIGLAVQPDILAGLAEARQFRGAGLLARFLYCLPLSLVGTRRSDASVPVPPQVTRDYSKGVQKLARVMRAAETTSEIKLSDRARKILDEFRDNDLEPRLHPERGDLAHIADWANKLAGQLVRIAALFTLFMDPGADEIAETEMRQALDLAPYFTGHALEAFELMSGRRSPLEPARAILTWIQRKRLTTFSVRQARRELAGQTWVTETNDVREALADLEDLGWIRPQLEPPARQSGRPSERYDVNPAAHQGFGNFGNPASP